MKEHAPGDPILPLSVAFEERMTRFESEEEVAEEYKKLGTKSALPKIITTMRTMMDLGSFFTTGTDEVRQWTIRKGTKAPQAAGVIHGGMCWVNLFFQALEMRCHFAFVLGACCWYDCINGWTGADIHPPTLQISKKHSSNASYTTTIR